MNRLRIAPACSPTDTRLFHDVLIVRVERGDRHDNCFKVSRPSMRHALFDQNRQARPQLNAVVADFQYTVPAQNIVDLGGVLVVVPLRISDPRHMKRRHVGILRRDQTSAAAARAGGGSDLRQVPGNIPAIECALHIRE